LEKVHGPAQQRHLRCWPHCWRNSYRRARELHTAIFGGGLILSNSDQITVDRQAWFHKRDRAVAQKDKSAGVVKEPPQVALDSIDCPRQGFVEGSRDTVQNLIANTWEGLVGCLDFEIPWYLVAAVDALEILPVDFKS
jgi:hypothetical protein